MNVDQFILTSILAMLLGAALCLIGTQIFERLNKYYKKLTFKHEVLEPYIPKKNKKDKE